MSTPNYRLIAREAIPVKVDCYNCEEAERLRILGWSPHRAADQIYATPKVRA